MLKLSICIPTFNRADFLREALSSILLNYNPNIEIIISDNNSSDNTEDVINEYKTIIEMNYSRNSSNIGPAKNLIKSANSASGDFIWFFSDDDVMIEGSVKYILDFLERHPYIDYVFVPRRLMNQELNKVVCDMQPTNIITDVIFSNGREMLSSNTQMSQLIGFFSSTFVRRDVWLQAAQELEIQSEWQHLAILLKAILNRKCAILGYTGVICRLNNSTLSTKSHIWFDEYIDCFNYAKNIGYPNNLCDSNIQQLVRSFSRIFVVDKAKKLRSDNIMTCLIKLNCFDISKITFPWFFLSFLPSSTLEVLLKIYTNIFHLPSRK